MNIYVIQYAGEISPNYHTGGGVLVVANDLEDAKKLCDAFDERQHLKLTEDEWLTAQVWKLAEQSDPEVLIFPDAGCC